MLQSIVQFSLRFRGIVIALALLVLADGIFVASRAQIDVFPDFVPPQATIQGNQILARTGRSKLNSS